jgi:hypothetical protein
MAGEIANDDLIPADLAAVESTMTELRPSC